MIMTLNTAPILWPGKNTPDCLNSSFTSDRAALCYNYACCVFMVCHRMVLEGVSFLDFFLWIFISKHDSPVHSSCLGFGLPLLGKGAHIRLGFFLFLSFPSGWCLGSRLIPHYRLLQMALCFLSGKLAFPLSLFFFALGKQNSVLFHRSSPTNRPLRTKRCLELSFRVDTSHGIQTACDNDLLLYSPLPLPAAILSLALFASFFRFCFGKALCT